MGKKTGRPRGRPPGVPNKITEERQKRINEAMLAAEEVLPEAFKGDAHALLITVYKDVSHPLPLRLDAAKAAISFEKPRLAAIEHSGEMTQNVVSDQPAPSPSEWLNAHADPDSQSSTTH